MENAARSPITVGAVIADTYRIERLLGRGGMGAVYLASHARLPGKQVAIKVLHAELTDDEIEARFRREAEIASRLGHPNIVTVHDFNVAADGTPYLVLEYLQGESLADRLRRGPVDLAAASSILKQVGSALTAAHDEGIVHRDLKPHNIFLVPTQIDGRVVEIAKVLDFGISKIRGSTTVQTQDSALLGTPQYMAPEQAQGQHDLVDGRTDVFALGAILYEMLSGKPAFAGASIPEVVFKVVYESPPALDANVPPHVANAVAKAMAKTRDDRFASVGELVEAVTGAPLVRWRPPSTQPPIQGFAAGSAPGAGRPPASGVPTDPLGATIASSSERGPTGSAAGAERIAGSTATVASVHPVSEDRKVAAPVPRRTTRTLVALGLAGSIVVVAVGIAYLAKPDRAPARSAAPADDAALATSRRGDRDASSVAPASPGRPTDAGTAARALPMDAGVASPASDARPLARSGRPDDAGTAASRAAEPERDVESDGGLAAIAEAWSAFRDGRLDVADRLATSITNGDVTDAQRAAGHAIKVAIACARQDLPGANSHLRQIGPRPRLVKRVRRACTEVGFALPGR